jgi:type III secretory pathway component EscS
LSLVGVVTAVTSAITGAVVSVVDSSSSLQEMMMRLKQKIRKTNITFFIFSSIPKVKYYCFV